jgi:hypothetical protein
MEPLRREMLPVLHRRHDNGEGLELEALLAEDGVGSKERDDLRQKIDAVPYHVDERSVRPPALALGRTRPQPSLARRSSRIEARSGFWLTWNSGTSCASRTVWTGFVGSRRGSFLPRRRIPPDSRPAFPADCPARSLSTTHLSDCHPPCRPERYRSGVTMEVPQDASGVSSI